MQRLSSPVPLVLYKADIALYFGQQVIIYGQYQRLSLRKSAHPDSPLVLTEKATLTLKDGKVIFIFPLWHEKSQRPPEELERYNLKAVKASGLLLLEQGNDPKAPQAARRVGPALLLGSLVLSPFPDK